MVLNETLLLSVLQMCAFVSVSGLVTVWAFYLRRVCHRFHQQFCHQIGERLSRSFIFLNPDRLFVMNLIAMGLAFLMVFVLTIRADAALFALFLSGGLPALLLHRLERGRRRNIAQQLPEMLTLLSSTLRSGASLGVALEHMAQQIRPPLGQELSVLQRERRLGVSLDDSLWNLLQRAPSDGMHLFTCLVRVSFSNGGGLAESLNTLAQVCRRQLLLKAKLSALTAQGRLQANVMTVIPLLVALALFVMEPELMSQLFTTRFGLSLCALVLLLLSLGAWMVRRIGRAS
jgi:tight adherence protein B